MARPGQLDREYGENALRASSLLARYGTEPHELQVAEVRHAMLSLAKGYLSRLEELVTMAKRDYRDVLWLFSRDL